MDTSQEGDSLFQGNFFHTSLTGYHLSINSVLNNGILLSPSTLETLVFFKFILSTLSSKIKSSASVITLPPKVGRSLNQPRIGIVVSPNIVVSNVDKNSFLSKSIFCAILPMVERPKDPTCN